MGTGNTASGENSSILGGQNNIVSGLNGIILGGQINNVTNQEGSIIGGNNNSVTANRSSILGGRENEITQSDGAIIGGIFNTVSGANSVIIGGTGSFVNGINSVIIGGVGLTNSVNNTVMVPDLNVQGGAYVNNNLDVDGQISVGTSYSNAFTSNTFNFDCDQGMVQHVDAQGMSANGTITFSNQKEGSTYTLLFVQGSGTYDVVLPSGYWLNDTAPFDFSTELVDDERAIITATYIFNAWYFAVKKVTYVA